MSMKSKKILSENKHRLTMKVYIYVTKGGKGLYRCSYKNDFIFGKEFLLCDRKSAPKDGEA